MRKLTLGTRLILGGILIVVVPLVIVGVLAVIKASDALTEVSREQTANVAAKLAEMTQVAVSEELIARLGSDPAFEARPGATRTTGKRKKNGCARPCGNDRAEPGFKAYR